ncbi:hypothetical protein PPSIR1_14015 [Plesiocystis pacifica SIR-1]|uniref:Uncharacterized protein n=1 Tax=Plesiocystis pacifica SIR-1 TaxID=391625 RepID=A6G8Y8_9BACT|nr:hypothetical protein [Plesiocystis pacifica]EDM77674.1 hypothetical protein PPSIR1_14015 [Plesiocystis pacifica SIR-1]
MPIVTQRYWCPECAAAYSQPGNCPTHRDEPLQDLAVPEVRLILEEQDDGAKQRHVSILIGVVAVIALFVMSGVFIVADYLDVDMNLIVVLFVVSGGLYAGAMSMFPYRSRAPEIDPEVLARFEAEREQGE